MEDNLKKICIYNADLLSDIQVHVEGKTYNCHKAILSNVSRFFYDQLVIKDCKETAITLNGVESNTFDIIHKFIYTADKEAVLMNVSFPSMIKLLDCADKLKMPHLIKSCIRVTQKRLRSITKHELMELSMKLYSLTFVQEMIKSCTPGLRHNLIVEAVKLGMGLHCIYNFMKITRLILSESERFEMLETWMRSQTKNLPWMDCVEKLLNLVDFNKLSVTEFQSVPGNSKL